MHLTLLSLRHLLAPTLQFTIVNPSRFHGRKQPAPSIGIEKAEKEYKRDTHIVLSE